MGEKRITIPDENLSNAAETAETAPTASKRGNNPSGVDANEPTDWGSRPPTDGLSRLDRLRWVAIRSIPTFALQFFTHPYIAGEKRGDAIAIAHQLYEKRGIHSTIDVLGESVTTPAETSEALDEYLQLIDDVGESEHISISVKLSSLGQGIDPELCDWNTERILRRAAKYHLAVRYDMEDHPTIDATLQTYRKFVDNFPRTGIVLQSMLFRTPADYNSLADLQPNVRGVIGIYREPPEIAYPDKPTMKEKLLELFDTMWKNDSYVAIATHDRRVIRRALSMADKLGKSTADYEVQMLLGVPLNRFQDELVARGIKVRLYVPYGEHWAAYCRRRLNANPNIAGLALRNFFRFGQ